MTSGRDKRQSSIPAQRLGMTTAEYIARREAGEKWCWDCERWQPVAQFPPNPTNPDGVGKQCRDCKRTYDRDRARRNAVTKPRTVRPARTQVAPQRPTPPPAPPTPPETDPLARAKARIAARRARQQTAA